MQERRRQFFQYFAQTAYDAAREFFAPELLSLELHELGQLVTSDDAVERIRGYLGGGFGTPS